MATTTIKKIPVAVVQGALQNAETATAREFVRPGFGATEEDDLLYAFGWPYMIWLEPGDASPKVLDEASKFSAKHPFEVGPTPVGVVARMLRSTYALAIHQNDELKWHKAILNGSPILEEEREKLFDALLTASFGFVETFLLEALFGQRVVLDALVKRTEEITDAKWERGGIEAFGGGYLRALHFVLLRADKDYGATMRARLDAVFERIKNLFENGSRALKALDMAIHGREGVERSGWRFGGDLQSDVTYVPDDAEYVRKHALVFIPKMKLEDRANVSARVAYLGGDEVMRAIAANVMNVHPAHRNALAVGLMRSGHEAVPEIMKALNTPTAKSWLKKRAGSVPPPNAT